MKLARILLILLIPMAISPAMSGYDAPLPDGFKSNKSSSIHFMERSSTSEVPTGINVGTGYYQSHQIEYTPQTSSLTWIKNTRTGESMNSEIQNARSINGSLMINADDSTGTDVYNSRSGRALSGMSSTQMIIDETVVDGQVHIGALQGNNPSGDPDSIADPSSTTWKNPAIEIDEDYVGTFHIEKNMTISVPAVRVQRDVGWLKCCGYSRPGLTEDDLSRTSPESIFDYRMGAAR